MTPIIRLDLSETGCQKPECKHRFSTPNRHHKRHEKKWINIFANRPPPDLREKGDGRHLLSLLKERYYAFRDQDVARICEWHHVEIHQIYVSRVYDPMRYKLSKRPEQFSWREMLLAMYRCRKLCEEWLKVKTPGLSPVAAKRRGSWG